MATWLAVFIGGGLGAISRFAVSKLTSSIALKFPLSTLISNIISCVILAIAVVFFSNKISHQSFLKPLIMIGFCGGFSTFSTFSFETYELIKTGNTFYAILNIVLSLSICLAIFYLGIKKL